MRRLSLIIVLGLITGCVWAQDSISAFDPSFGHVLDLEDDVLAIGAPGYQDGRGGIWIFQRSDGRWHQVYNALGAAGDSLGFSLALDGTYLVAGAPGQQAACWYSYVQGAWGMEDCHQIRREGFGRAVASSGIFSAVGSPDYDRRTGAVDMFIRSSQGTWEPHSTLHGKDEHTAFGASLAMSAEILLVGAPLSDGPQGRDVGLAYVFGRTGGSDWVLTEVLTAGNAQGMQEFSRTSALFVGHEHTYAVFGAPRTSTSFLFFMTDSLWQQTDVFRPIPAAPWQASGISLDLDGSTAIIGSPSNVPGQRGSAFVLNIDQFHNWHLSHVLDRGPTFGASVDIDGSYLVVGSPGEAVYGFEATALSTRSEEKKARSIAAYPNPFADALTFVVDASVQRISIWDISGRLIESINTAGRMSHTWHPQGLTAGVYVASANGTTATLVYMPR